MKKAILIMVVLFGFASLANANEEDFNKWVVKTKQQAIKKGISEDLVNKAFEGVHYKEKIIKQDRNQPEVKKTFEVYLEQVVCPYRIKKGQVFYYENKW